MIVELDSLMIERERLELVIKEEVHRLLSQLQRETLQEGHIVIDDFVIILGDHFEVLASNQLIQETVPEDVD
jgi:hypothetical protein